MDSNCGHFADALQAAACAVAARTLITGQYSARFLGKYCKLPLVQGMRKWFICCWIMGQMLERVEAYYTRLSLRDTRSWHNEADVKAIWNSETALYQRLYGISIRKLTQHPSCRSQSRQQDQHPVDNKKNRISPCAGAEIRVSHRILGVGSFQGCSPSTTIDMI